MMSLGFGLLGTPPAPYAGQEQTATAAAAPSLFGSLGCGFLGLWPSPQPYQGDAQPRAVCGGFLSSPPQPYAPVPPTPSLPAPTPTTGGAGGGGSRGNAGRVPR